MSAIGILHRVMAMIPGSAVLPDWELIGEMVTGCDGTLSDAVDAIMLHGVQLPQPVPMDARPIGQVACAW